MLKQLCLLLLCLAVAAAGVRAEIIEQILVKVNGEISTKSDLEQRQVAALRQKGQQFDPKNDPENQQLRKAPADLTPPIMGNAVDELHIVQRGTEPGSQLSDWEVKALGDD